MGEYNIVELTDELGNAIRFGFLDLIQYRQKEYVLLLPPNNDDGQVVILELASIDGWQRNYVGVENKFILETAFALFQERNKDVFNFG